MVNWLNPDLKDQDDIFILSIIDIYKNLCNPKYCFMYKIKLNISQNYVNIVDFNPYTYFSHTLSIFYFNENVFRAKTL